ncbi:MAG: hypothetical protein K6C09_01665 [Oscillospiraceae bacterium]|nr:hypothetical protein [Oscillospiraceae bacterium]
MSFSYDEIREFMLAYFPSYAEKAQDPVLQPEMDRFYAPDISFDNGMNSREQWYRACLSHPAVVDILTVERLCIDERNLFVSAMVTSRPTERETGKVLLEIGMNAFYRLKADEEGRLKIARIDVFLESDPRKAAQMFEIYAPKR